MKIHVVIVEEKDLVGEKCLKFLIDFKIHVLDKLIGYQVDLVFLFVKPSSCRSKFGLLLLFNIGLFSSPQYPEFDSKQCTRVQRSCGLFLSIFSLAIKLSLHIYRLFLLIQPVFRE